MRLRKFLNAPKLRIADQGFIVFGVVASFGLRLNLEQLVLDYIPALAFMLMLALIIKPLVYRRMGLYQRLWAYASIGEMRLIIQAVSLASLLVAFPIIISFFIELPFTAIPRSVLIIDWLASLALVGGIRFAMRLFNERKLPTQESSEEQNRNVLIVGAGSAGALVLRELTQNPRAGFRPVGFLDDDPDKLGHKVNDVEILGPVTELPKIAQQTRASEVIFAIPSASGRILREVAEICRRENLSFRTIPGIYELIGGEVRVNRLREVDITDLLRRKPVLIDRKRIGDRIRNQRVMITGAGGSIAGELCRQIARWDPAELILVGHGENSIFEIIVELSADFPDLLMRPYVCDIRNLTRLTRIVNKHNPEILFHAAAHKHVPLMEINISEAISNNVIGTRNVVDVALQANVPRLVMISTDKAVKPSSVMGATKRVAEWIVLDAKVNEGQIFSVVRFGNVLGSRGSVVPLFKRQIEMGGPVTVTDEQMERYFMTIPEAVHLVLQAFTFDKAGQTYMLNMGDPVRISDLARDLVRLSGLEPGEDIDIVYTGLRPGEKLSEELWEDGVEYQTTEHPEISSVVEPKRLSGKKLQTAVKKLEDLSIKGQRDKLLKQLSEILPNSELGTNAPNELQSLI